VEWNDRGSPWGLFKNGLVFGEDKLHVGMNSGEGVSTA
jgi:hypothetical protein